MYIKYSHSDEEKVITKIVGDSIIMKAILSYFFSMIGTMLVLMCFFLEKKQHIQIQYAVSHFYLYAHRHDESYWNHNGLFNNRRSDNGYFRAILS